MLPKGKKQTIRTAQKIRSLFSKVDLIVTSPYVRAHETAVIISEVLGINSLDLPQLTPENSPDVFLKWLRANCSDSEVVIVVGHEPHLGQLISYLLSGQPRAFIELKKSGAACVRVDSLKTFQPGQGQLQWLIKPKLIER